MERKDRKKKRVDIKEGAKIAEKEIEQTIEEFESMYPGFYVKAVDYPPAKLHWEEGEIRAGSTIGRDEPDWKQKSEKRPKYRPWRR